MSLELRERLARVRLLAMDVDGTLTDGFLDIPSEGLEGKRFHVADGLGLNVMRQNGFQIAWISGRAAPSVQRRAAELKVTRLLEGIKDKRVVLAQLASEMRLQKDEIAYIGDDWNDLLAFDSAGVRIAVANSADALKMAADYVTKRRGGEGAVREVCEMILEAWGLHEAAVQRYLENLQAEAQDTGQ
jgi:3-deoxy-D-manno-octulosonate 8-phosphate phosphatase (KDO 8-P phosphatase)